jgi:cyclophilin family peptidyl-prolyl cis-trans isomerase
MPARLLRFVFLLTLTCASAIASTVRLQTNLGAIDIVLYDTEAPRTVSNFLRYVTGNAYDSTFVHRSVPGFVIQGGGYQWTQTQNTYAAIPTLPPIQNEFSAARSNVRGSVAMAKFSNDPHSATSQWFINLANNSSSLDTGNGGYTVFGYVTQTSMAVVDAIAALPRVNAGVPFNELPLASAPTASGIQRANLVMIERARTIGDNYQGLWWNSSESGWGMSLAHKGSTVFVALYTYDAGGRPAWYVISNCALSGNACSGELYRVNGGTAPVGAWSAAALVTQQVGFGTIRFADANNASFDFSINGISGHRAITRQVFGTPGAAPATDYTDVWWNAAESGWGIALTQQYGTLFAAWYTYDADGRAVWYAATNCPIVGNSCTADVFQVTGGTPITSPWTAANRHTAKVGELTLTFTSTDTATMSYTLNGLANTRSISRLQF